MLLLLTIALVLVGAVALVIGFVNDAMFPIYLSIACSLAAAVVLVIFSRLSKARLEPAVAPAAIADEPTGPLLIGRETDFPIPDYDDRRVAEIVPLLADLDLDELEMVRQRETAGRNRTTIVRRIDDLIAESDTEPAVGEEEQEETLVGAAASFGREEDEVDLEEDLEDLGDEAVEDDLFPIAEYDELSVAEILPLLDELTLDELEEVGDREADGQNRAAILDRVDELLDEGEAAEAAAPKKAAPKKTTVKKAAASKQATTKKASAGKKAPAKKAAATKGTGKKATAKKAAATKTGATKKAAASKSGAKKTPAKKAAAKRAR